MAVKCPKCQFENTSDSKFCKECGTQLIPSEESHPSVTKTLLTPSRRLELGSIFAERYEVFEQIGKGGMGEVYRVMDLKLEEEMALKLLKPEIAAEKEIIERFIIVRVTADKANLPKLILTVSVKLIQNQGESYEKTSDDYSFDFSTLHHICIPLHGSSRG